MDNATYYRAMKAFCLQKAKMEHENEDYWMKEARSWDYRLAMAGMFDRPPPKFPSGSWWS